MTFRALGSSSFGNCYLLSNETEKLIIEAGLLPAKIVRGIGYNLLDVAGVVVSHAHTDHSLSADYFSGIGIPVFKPYENFRPSIKMGNFTIIPFELVHDVPCYGFYITHKEIGVLVYLTDTEYCKYRFPKANHLAVEANYDKRLIADDYAARKHVLAGHMELQTTKQFIRTNAGSCLRNIILLHVSGSNMDYGVLEREIREVSGRAGLSIAKPGLEVNINRLPF